MHPNSDYGEKDYVLPLRTHFQTQINSSRLLLPAVSFLTFIFIEHKKAE